jgi:hypothetical protein
MNRWAPLAAALFLGAIQAASGQVIDNPHGKLPQGVDCSACHTASGWKPLRTPLGFTHGARGGFLITGAHAHASCSGCHRNLRFSGPDVAMNECAGCHVDVHQGRTSQECVTCHTTTSFQDVDGEMIHARTSFPLTGAHTQVTCESCHIDDEGGAFTALATDCVSCHMTSFQEARAIDHVAAGYPTDCTRCHGTLAWADEPSFDHAGASGGFALIGAHVELRCTDCHAQPGMEPLFAATDQNDCVACHQEDFDQRHAGTTFPTTCLTCHTVDSWGVENFDHGLTGFPLLGRHTGLKCATCHTQDGRALKFSPPASRDDCAACHRGDYDEEHAGSGFPVTCLSCHNVNGWDKPSFNHTATAFPLLGVHAKTACTDCHGPPAHLSKAFAGTEACVACHQGDYDGKHKGSGFPTKCLSCHSQATWAGASFDHVGLAGGFALEGPHAKAACGSCHAQPDYALKFPKPATQQDCVACHRPDYDATHVGSDFPTTCLTCHAADRWEGAAFDHAGATGFPLVESHAKAPCTSCHTRPGYALKVPKPAKDDDCLSCHQADYDTHHAGSGFPTTCLTCHGQVAWAGAKFDHAASTGFALLDGHATVPCVSCHAPPGYALKFPKPATQDDCVACHRKEYDAKHAGSGFPTTCLSCHARGTWTGAKFDHAASTGFALLDGHATVPCASCHTLPGYALKFPKPAIQDDCVACHRKDYDANHAGSGFPTACLSCHAKGTWGGAKFDHAASTGFGLVGPHAPLECKACHASPGNVLLFPKPASQDDCVACHQAAYDANHAGSGFPTRCLNCHAPDRWSGAKVDHVALSRGFALLGAHATATCASCHAIPGYGLLFPPPTGPNDCVACHRREHTSAHGAAGYPTDCAACHTVNAWRPSTFNHDTQYFPIYSGKHRGQWTTCTQCHASPSALSVFSCLTCHEHQQSDMDSKHKGRKGYSYTSAACLSCHPAGRTG